MSERIRAVIFDVGGVLVRTLDHSARRAWEQRLGLPAGGAEAIVLNSETGHRAQRGEISDGDLWEWVQDHLGLADRIDDFRHDFWGGDAVDPQLVSLIKSLRPRYQLAIISNATDSLNDTLVHYDLRQHFDLVVGSAYEGVMKPDPVIFRRALESLGRKPAEAVFIDDAPANVQAARQIGMKAIQFVNYQELVSQLEGLGVAVWTDP